MRQFIGKRCKIEIKKDFSLFYTANVLSVSENIITFIDREGKLYSFNEKDVKEIHEE